MRFIALVLAGVIGWLVSGWRAAEGAVLRLWYARGVSRRSRAAAKES